MKPCPVCESRKNLTKKDSYPQGSVYECTTCYVGLFDGGLPIYSGADIEEKNYIKFLKRFILTYEFRYLRKMKPMRILEVGSGSGELALLLSKFGHYVTCNDIDKKSLARISRRQKLKTLYGSIEKLSIPSFSFDAIILRHTFEHMDNPKKIIQSIRRILTKRGVIIITLPNYDSLCRKIIGKGWSGFSIPSHRYFWTIPGLSAFLRKNGFKIVKKKTLFSHYGLPLNLLSLTKNRGLRWVLLPVLFFFGGMLEVFFVQTGKGQNLFVEAQKL